METNKLIYRYRGTGKTLARTLNEISGGLYCASSNQLNDPFDGITEAKDEQGKLAITSDQIINVTKQWTAACFTENWNSPTMWAHYTEGFNGVCLAYDLNLILERVQNGIEEFGRPLKRMGSQCYFDIVEYHKKMPYPYKDSKEAIFSKTIDWAYEKEWRFAIQTPLGVEGTRRGFSVSFDGLLKQILIGANVDVATINCLRHYRDTINRDIEIRQMSIDKENSGYKLGPVFK